MGFLKALKTILKYIPHKYQTLIFSATRSKNTHHLTRLHLKVTHHPNPQSPERIILNELKLSDISARKEQDPSKKINMSQIVELPSALMQYYIVEKIENKLDVLFSFLKNHRKQKILVFFNTCKQVRFAYLTFTKLRLGIPLLEFQGRQKQPKRMAIFYTFQEKRYSVLLTTNIAARGIDFPYVNWVIQVDCPEDVNTYVHRIGRTARYKASGKSILMLDPSETGFVSKLKTRDIHVHKIQVNLHPNP